MMRGRSLWQQPKRAKSMACEPPLVMITSRLSVFAPLREMSFLNVCLVSSLPEVAVYLTIPLPNSGCCPISFNLLSMAGCIGRLTFPMEALIASVSSVRLAKHC